VVGLTADVDVPELDVPELDVPELDVPELDVPELDVPELDVPELDVPELDVAAIVSVGVTPRRWLPRGGPPSGPGRREDYSPCDHCKQKYLIKQVRFIEKRGFPESAWSGRRGSP
jgi:hypothetical protein